MDQVRFSIEDAIMRRGKDAELLVLVACLVQALGNEVCISMQSIEDVMKLKELLIIRNDVEDGKDPSITLKVIPYEKEDIN